MTKNEKIKEKTQYVRASTLKILNENTNEIVDEFFSVIIQNKLDEKLKKGMDIFIRKHIYLNFFSYLDPEITGPKIGLKITDEKVVITQKPIILSVDSAGYPVPRYDKKVTKRFTFTVNDDLCEMDVVDEISLLLRSFFLPNTLVQLLAAKNKKIFKTMLDEIVSARYENYSFNKAVFSPNNSNYKTEKERFLDKINQTIDSLSLKGKLTKKEVYDAMGYKKSTFNDKCSEYNIEFDRKNGIFVDLENTKL